MIPKIITFLLLFPIFAKAQFVETKDAVYYEKVVVIEDKTKDDLFLAAKEWYATAFMDAHQIIRFENRVNGKIVARGDLPFKTKMDNITKVLGVVSKGRIKSQLRLWFVIKVYFKEGKTKISLTKMRIVSLKGATVQAAVPLAKFYFDKDGQPRKHRQNLKKDVIATIDKFILDFEQSVKRNSEISDW